MTRFIYGKDPNTGARKLLDEVPTRYDHQITDEDIREIWSQYSDIEIKSEKESEDDAMHQ